MNQETIDDQFTDTRLRRRDTIYNRINTAGMDTDEDSVESEEFNNNNNEYAGKTDYTDNDFSHFENGLISSTDVITDITEYCYRTAKTDPTIPKNYNKCY